MSKPTTYLPDHPRANHLGYVRNDVLAIEEKLQRHLLPPEVLYHVNGDDNDCRADKILVFRTRGDLFRFLEFGLLIEHEDGSYSSPARIYTKECTACKQKFTTASPNQEVCSNDCYYKLHNFARLPSRDLLVYYLAQHPVSWVARKMNVTADVVYAWCHRLEVFVKDNPRKLVDNGKYYIPDLVGIKGNKHYHFKNMAHAVSYLRLFRDVDKTPTYIRGCIFRVVRGEKLTYCGFKWKSKLYHYRLMCARGEFEVEDD